MVQYNVAGGLLALSDRGAGVPLRELALVGLTAAIITYFATGPVRLLATRLGAVAYPRERDVHVTPTPRMGGLAMYLGVIAAVFLASQLPAAHTRFRLLLGHAGGGGSRRGDHGDRPNR